MRDAGVSLKGKDGEEKLLKREETLREGLPVDLHHGGTASQALLCLVLSPSHWGGDPATLFPPVLGRTTGFQAGMPWSARHSAVPARWGQGSLARENAGASLKQS